MKILKNLLITFLLLAAVTSCGKNGEEGKIDSNSGDNAGNNNSAAQESPPEEVFLSGKVISVSHNSDGIADFTLLTDDSSVCRVTPGAISRNAVSVGQKVLVTVDGSVLESDPMQAVAENVDVTEEFNEMPLDIEVYTVYSITASKISEALTSSGYRFYRFGNYGECLDFLAENELSAEFEKTVGDTDISALTDAFFEKNDLCVFVVNSAGVNGNQVDSVYGNGDELYLSLVQTSENAVLVNTKFDVFLLPLSKDLETGEGFVLTEKYLEPNLGDEEKG